MYQKQQKKTTTKAEDKCENDYDDIVFFKLGNICFGKREEK